MHRLLVLSLYHYKRVRVTFILTDPETNRTLPAIEAIMVLQQSDAQAALVSDNIPDFAIAGRVHFCNTTLPIIIIIF